MAPTRICRWVLEAEPLDPWANMACDAELLAALAEGNKGLSTIRVYQWDRPSVSIGRLQNEDAVQQIYPGLPIVRRPTGGRAVLHGSDLTVSVTAQREWLPQGSGQGTLRSYRQIMAGIVSALSDSGISTTYGTDDGRRSRTGINCFDTAAGCDLIDRRTGRKIAGSAQRRLGDAILQQTSLPVEFLPDLDLFVSSLKQNLQRALDIEEWVVN